MTQVEFVVRFVAQISPLFVCVLFRDPILTMFASLDMMMLAGLAFDTNGRFIGICRSASR